jgi:hypothetical protein
MGVLLHCCIAALLGLFLAWSNETAKSAYGCTTGSRLMSVRANENTGHARNRTPVTSSSIQTHKPKACTSRVRTERTFQTKGSGDLSFLELVRSITTSVSFHRVLPSHPCGNPIKHFPGVSSSCGAVHRTRDNSSAAWT